ncbi:PilZ domain-containing protein [Methylophaga sp.]|uniref:PilZ domain-containing protein n=1 Tax=Methylophaga sp. TaxID=2024840 RepID=UPI00271EF740|nr:PilZ domain-containing protein [Methylophaga sp.]MDO8827490.1 PilZ domain-containing protein [Methylophaga sp.]
MTSQDFEEKRNFFRMRVNGPVKIERQDPAETFDAEGLDLSASGLSLISDDVVNEGEILQISIKSHNPELADFVAEAKVLRVQPSEDQPERFNISVKFTTIY